MKRLLLLAWLLALASPALADVPDLSGFAYRQRPGAHLPPQAEFRDAAGRTVRLGELGHGMPLVLALGYFHCPNLCGVVRDDMFHALGATSLKAGRDYTLVVLSIDPSETVADAKAAKAQDIAAFGSPDASRSWRYLTGSPDAIRAVADAVGFRDRLDPQTKQFVHPAGLVFATPGGVISSYLLGVGYTPTDMRAAVARADAGGLATIASPVLLLCFHFDPTTGRYTLAIIKLLRLAGVLTVLTLGGTLFLAFRRDRRPP